MRQQARRIPRDRDPPTDTGKRRRLPATCSRRPCSAPRLFRTCSGGWSGRRPNSITPSPVPPGRWRKQLWSDNRLAAVQSAVLANLGERYGLDLSRRQPLRGMPGVRPAPACVCAPPRPGRARGVDDGRGARRMAGSGARQRPGRPTRARRRPSCRRWCFSIPRPARCFPWRSAWSPRTSSPNASTRSPHLRLAMTTKGYGGTVKEKRVW